MTGEIRDRRHGSSLSEEADGKKIPRGYTVGKPLSPFAEWSTIEGLYKTWAKEKYNQMGLGVGITLNQKLLLRISSLESICTIKL